LNQLRRGGRDVFRRRWRDAIVRLAHGSVVPLGAEPRLPSPRRSAAETGGDGPRIAERCVDGSRRRRVERRLRSSAENRVASRSAAWTSRVAVGWMFSGVAGATQPRAGRLGPWFRPARNHGYRHLAAPRRRRAEMVPASRSDALMVAVVGALSAAYGQARRTGSRRGAPLEPAVSRWDGCFQASLARCNRALGAWIRGSARRGTTATVASPRGGGCGRRVLCLDLIRSLCKTEPIL